MTDKAIQQAGRHSVYTQRIAGHIANQFDPYLEFLLDELRLAVLMFNNTGDLSKINKMIKDYDKAATGIYSDYNKDILLTELKELAAYETGFTVDSISDGMENPVPISQLTNAQTWSAVTSEPLLFEASNGVKLLSPFIADWEAGQVKIVGDMIRTGFITGQTNQQIVSNIAGKNGYMQTKNKQSIKTMVRTATNHVSNTARLSTYGETSLVKGYEIVATLDMRTSNICKGYDGLIVKKTDKKKPKPPFHPNCRTTTAPVLDKRFMLDDSVATRASRGVEGGQQVKANQTYYDWLKTQGGQGAKGRAFVEDVLGKERADLFLDGGLSVNKFKQLTLDELFQPIPLDELRTKNSLQLAFDKI